VSKIKQNKSDISLIHRKKLIEIWESDKKKKSPTDYFKMLPHDTQIEFHDKLYARCLQILKKNKGYNQWAYGNFRYDKNGPYGAENLAQEVHAYLFKSNKKDAFVNLKELLKDGSKNINRNLTSIIRRVLTDKRKTTVIDQLLKRIEMIVDDKSTKFIRTRTKNYGPKADYFYLKNKTFEERLPTHLEIEKAISAVGDIEETPVKKNAKQASRVYTTAQLKELLEKVCLILPTDVTPNTLERIFIDLIPEYLPPDFLIEKVFKVYGNVNFNEDIEANKGYRDLSPLDQMIVIEIIKEALSKITKKRLKTKIKKLRTLIVEKDPKPKMLVKNKLFTSEEKAEKFLNDYYQIVKEMYSSTGNTQLSEISFKIMMQIL